MGGSAASAGRTHALCTNPYSSQKIITTIYTICIIRIDSFLYPMACPVQPREDIPFTNPSRSIPTKNPHFAFHRQLSPLPRPLLFMKIGAIFYTNCIIHFVSTTLYPQILPHKTLAIAPSCKPIQREIALFSMHFRKPPVPLKFPLIAKSSLKSIQIVLCFLFPLI